MKNDVSNIPSHLHISDPNLLQYKFHHIVIKFYHQISLELEDQSLRTAFGGQFFSTQKMYISEYACRTCLKELGILLKCRKVFEKFLAACNSSKNAGLPQVFFPQFNKNQKVPIVLTFTNSKLPDECQITDKQYHIFQKSKSYKISNIDIYIGEDLEFIKKNI